MNREDLYHKTVNKLLDAYNKNELRHSDCQACAVGNILNSVDTWYKIFMTEYCEDIDEQPEYIPHRNFHYMTCDLELLNDRYLADELSIARKAINNSGYTAEELAEIEWAFETALPAKVRDYYQYDNPIEGQYLGLCAVLNKLKEIHSKEDNTVEKTQLRIIKDRKLEEIQS